MHERRNINAASFSSQNGLLHGEKRGRKRHDAQARQLAAGLHPLPCRDHLDTKSGLVEAWLQPSTYLRDTCSSISTSPIERSR